MDLALPGWLVKAVQAPFRWIVLGAKRLRSKRRVKQYLLSLDASQAGTLFHSYKMAKERGNRIFDWRESWVGFGDFESRLVLIHREYDW